MYSNTGYLSNVTNEIEDYTSPLAVTSCGVYRLVNQAIMLTTRPRGRKDYQLLYVSSGIAFFDIKEQKDYKVSAGHMILYRPGAAQRYHYHVEDHPEVCWIHFSGYDADNLLDKIGFGNTDILTCGSLTKCHEYFYSMIQELQLKRPCFEEIISFSLQQLFTEIHRSQLESSNTNYWNHSEIIKAINYFNESYSQNICIDTYAKSRNMSVCWFIRIFRKYIGVPPMRYITFIRINKAKDLLISTNYSIQEIGVLVGYENPLYFSRIFKKQTGYSPSHFRHM